MLGYVAIMLLNCFVNPTACVSFTLTQESVFSSGNWRWQFDGTFVSSSISIALYMLLSII